MSKHAKHAHAQTMKEIEQMNKLILKLIDAPQFTKSVLESIVDEMEGSQDNFITSDGFVEVTHSDIDRHLELEFKSKFDENGEFDVPTCVYDYVQQNIDWKELNGAIEDLKEALRDAEEYRRDPLGYVGMSTKDFL